MLKFRTEIKQSDITTIEKIIKSTGNFSNDEVEVAKELIITQLNNPADSYQFVFLEDEKNVLGYSCFGKIPCTENNYDLYWIAVAKNTQNIGLGKKILEETERLIKKERGLGIYIETSSSEKYKNTQKFYLKNNYQEIARFEDFYKIGDAKIVYCKKITLP